MTRVAPLLPSDQITAGQDTKKATAIPALLVANGMQCCCPPRHGIDSAVVAERCRVRMA